MIYFETPEQAEAISLARKIPIMTLALPSEKDCFSVTQLEELSAIKLGMIFRQNDREELKPLLDYFQDYFMQHQHDFLPMRFLTSDL